MALLELFGTPGCEYTAEMREWLEWNGREFVEYDVERDHVAFRRMQSVTGGQHMVPVLLDNGAVDRIGWNGRGCFVAQPK